MGFELIIGGLMALTSAVGGMAQASAAKSAARAQRKARDTSAAQDKVNSMESVRQRIREERVRRAQILASSENTGSGGSSGAIGSVGALNTNLGGLISSAAGQSKANQSINAFNQQAADHTTRGNTFAAWTQTINQGLGGFQSVFDK